MTRALALLCLLFAAPAAAETLTSLTAEQIGAVLASEGAVHEVGVDSVGDPMIQVTTGSVLPGQGMRVIFYDCSDAGACEDITLWSWFSVPDGVNYTALNAYNRDNRWVRAYVDADGDAVLEMDINATGGIGPDALRILIRTYFRAMRSFSAAIGAY